MWGKVGKLVLSPGQNVGPSGWIKVAKSGRWTKVASKRGAGVKMVKQWVRRKHGKVVISVFSLKTVIFPLFGTFLSRVVLS